MLIYVDPDTLKVMHTQTHYPPGHADAMRALGEAVIETDEPYEIEEICITPEGALFRKSPMEIKGPSSIKLGETAVFTGIPEGASVTINENDFTMTETTLELEPEVAGTYTLKFWAYGYIPKEMSVEAVG